MKPGKKQDIPNSDLGNQEGNESIKMYKIEKNENILLFLWMRASFYKIKSEFTTTVEWAEEMTSLPGVRYS